MRFNVLLGAGFAAAMIAASAAADFTGVSAQVMSGQPGLATQPGTGFYVTRLFADFSDPGDRLLSVIDADYTNAGDQQLYQNPLSSGVEPLAALIPAFPDLKWTSYVTIGHRATVIGQPTTSFDPDGEWTASGFTGGYFVPGDAPQGLAGFDLKVLIAQLTIQNPNASAAVAGTATIAWSPAGGGPVQFTEIDFAPLLSPPLPAASALPLLAIAGLAGRARDRC